MKCQKCYNTLVESNIIFDHITEDIYYTRYFCFNCDTLYECKSESGDMTEENLDELGEVKYL